MKCMSKHGFANRRVICDILNACVEASSVRKTDKSNQRSRIPRDWFAVIVLVRYEILAIVCFMISQVLRIPNH